jgi:hypothetical protein
MDKEIVISCFWCGRVKTRNGEWVEFDEEINLALFAEAYEIVVKVCPNCLAEEAR